MNFRKYFMRGGIFGAAGIISAIIELFFLWFLTTLGIWYLFSAVIGHVIGGLILYNLNVISGNIKLAGTVKVPAECGCIVKWNLICPTCERCTLHCDCDGVPKP